MAGGGGESEGARERGAPSSLTFLRRGSPRALWFAGDSPLEGDGFELPVPRVLEPSQFIRLLDTAFGGSARPPLRIPAPIGRVPIWPAAPERETAQVERKTCHHQDRWRIAGEPHLRKWQSARDGSRLRLQKRH